MAEKENPAEPKAVAPVAAPDTGTLLDAATYNLNIAHQYIDEASFPAENRLISFHYGVALLARYRDRPEMRSSAREYFETAVNWRVLRSDRDAVRVFHRIVAESYYNLGVIDELDGKLASAWNHYGKAIQFAQEAEETHLFTGLIILAGFGIVSVRYKILMSAATVSDEPFDSERAQLRDDIANLLKFIQENESRIPVAQRQTAVYVQKPEAPPPPPPVRAAELNADSTAAENLLLRQIAAKLDEIRGTLG